MASAIRRRRCDLRASRPCLEAALPFIVRRLSIRSCRDAILISLLSQMVRATSERMTLAVSITLVNRLTNSARLGELCTPGDFIEVLDSNVRKDQYIALTQRHRAGWRK